MAPPRMMVLLVVAVAAPAESTQETSTVEVFWKATTAPAGIAVEAEDEAVAVSVAKLPFGVKPESVAENVPETGDGRAEGSEHGTALLAAVRHMPSEPLTPPPPGVWK